MTLKEILGLHNVLSFLQDDKTRVVHKKKAKFDVYIGRPSIFGNPYSVMKYGRQGCIHQYRLYFYNKIKKDPEFKKKVLDLKGKTLGCWCKPLACHGDIIAEYINV